LKRHSNASSHAAHRKSLSNYRPKRQNRNTEQGQNVGKGGGRQNLNNTDLQTDRESDRSRRAYQVDISEHAETDSAVDHSNDNGHKEPKTSLPHPSPNQKNGQHPQPAIEPLGEDQERFNPEAAWQATLTEMALRLQASSYDTWIRDAKLIAHEDGEFIVGLPNAYVCDWVENRLRSTIKRILRSIVKREVQITFCVSTSPLHDADEFSHMPLYGAAHLEDDAQDDNTQAKDLQNADSDRTETDVDASRTVPRSALEQNDADLVPKHEPAPRRVSHVRPPGEDFSNSLNSHHTFDAFVVGNHNRLAHAAALAVANQPGQQYNPLFLYGGVGLGKTHLLHAIGNLAHRNGFNTLYCSSEQFTNDLISAIRGQSTEKFRNKYRRVDILLIDDIQFIGGKESTQEEFFHTFNHLQSSGAQVILSSDRPPKALATLEERLRSRFEGGLQTDIAQPDFETRVAILQTKAKKIGIPVPQDVLMLVAERVDSNIRELEGALNQLHMHAQLSKATLNMSLAMTVLDNLAPSRTPCTPGTLIRIVAEYYGLTEVDIVGRRRTKLIASARQVAMYLLRVENCLSLPAIGELVGGRDHTTVRYGVEQVTKRLEKDDALHQAVAQLRERVYTPYIG